MNGHKAFKSRFHLLLVHPRAQLSRPHRLLVDLPRLLPQRCGQALEGAPPPVEERQRRRGRQLLISYNV